MPSPVAGPGPVSNDRLMPVEMSSDVPGHDIDRQAGGPGKVGDVRHGRTDRVDADHCRADEVPSCSEKGVDIGLSVREGDRKEGVRVGKQTEDDIGAVALVYFREEILRCRLRFLQGRNPGIDSDRAAIEQLDVAFVAVEAAGQAAEQGRLASPRFADEQVGVQEGLLRW
nr:hypothetical protein [uncultured bacterium]